MSCARTHAKNKALVHYWREKMNFWLIHQEFELGKDYLDQIALDCALDAMNTLPHELGRLRQRLFDLGATEEEIANPPFFVGKEQLDRAARYGVELVKI